MEINGPRRDKKFKSHHHIDTDRHNAWRKVKYFLVYSESWQLLLADKVTLTAGGPGNTCDRREESDPLMIVNLTLHWVSIVKDKLPKQNEFASKFAKRKPSPRTFAIFCEAQRPVQCLSVRRALESGGGLRHNFLRLKYHHHHYFCFRITINSSQIYIGFTKRTT